jgi:hypothetical protein
MKEDHSVERKRKQSPSMDATQDKGQKRQHTIADQDVSTPSAVEEEFALQTTPSADASKDSRLDLQESGYPPSIKLPEHLHHLQRISLTYFAA